MANQTKKDSAIALRSLWDTGIYSDLTIRCHDKVFEVHRAIVCPRSKYFAAAADGQFKEGVLHEIELPADEPHIIAAILEYMYTGDYQEYILPNSPAEMKRQTRDKSPPIQTLIFNTKVYIAADIFDIPALKLLATEKYELEAAEKWKRPEFTKAADLLWTNTVESDRILRNAVVSTAIKHLDALLARDDFLVLMKNRFEFSLHLVQALKKASKSRDSRHPEGNPYSRARYLFSL